MTEYPQGGPDGDPDVPPTPAEHGQSQPPQYGAPQYGAPQYGAPQYGAPQYGTPAAAPVSDADRRLWAMLGHLGGIILGWLAPLIVFLIYKDRDEFIKDQSTESLNFQITMFIGWVVAFVLTFAVIGIILYPILFIANIVLCIMAGMAANRGERYRYPFAIRLVK